MIDEQLPCHSKNYSYSDILDHLLFKDNKPTASNTNPVQSEDVDELTR